MSDFPQLVSYLKRTAEHASYDMTVATSMVKKMIAGAEFAEAYIAAIDGYEAATAAANLGRKADWHAVDQLGDRADEALAAYRKARVAR